MILSIFAVTLIAFFVLTVWFEAPVEPVRRAGHRLATDRPATDRPVPDDALDQAKDDLGEAA